MDSVDFTSVSAQLVRDLERMEEFSRTLQLDKSIGLISDSIDRLSRHRFSVAVVGEFKTGKSTFVNALLGSDIVPTDILPTTATPNRITYGLETKTEVHYKNGHTETIASTELRSYVTKQDASISLLESIDEVVVYDQSPYLMNGVDLIDTPGLNDEDSMTQVTLSVLPKTDAAILVISALNPLSQYTRTFLERYLAPASLGQVLFLVNQIGRLNSPADADKIIAYVEQQIREKIVARAQQELGPDNPKFAAFRAKLGNITVYGMDAYQALQGRAGSDAALVEKSRFPQFDLAIRKLLTADRGVLVLQAPVNRVLASAQEILLAIHLRSEGLKMQASSFEDKYKNDADAITALRDRKQQELAAVDAKATEALSAASVKLAGVQARILAAIHEHIMAAELTDDEITSDKATAGQKLMTIANDLRNNLANQELEAASQVVNTHLNQASARAQQFAGDVESAIKQISIDIDTADQREGQTFVGRAGALLLAFPGLSGTFAGVYEGYKQAGVKGAITGGVTGFSASFVTAGLLLLVDAPLLPVLAAMAFAGWAGGAKVTKFFFPAQRAQNFKQAILKQIDDQFAVQGIEAKLQEMLKHYSDGAFDGLRNILLKEIKAVLDNTQQTLDSLRDKHTRQEVESSHEAAQYESIAAAVHDIAERAAALNQVLLKRIEAN